MQLLRNSKNRFDENTVEETARCNDYVLVPHFKHVCTQKHFLFQPVGLALQLLVSADRRLIMTVIKIEAHVK